MTAIWVFMFFLFSGVIAQQPLTVYKGSMSSEIDFTSGPLGRELVAFAMPLLLGNLFQQLYNAADSLIVGNFLGREALAAVSSSGPIIFMLVGFFNGLAAGAGVVISRAYGAHDGERLGRAIHTDTVFGIIAGIALTIVSVLFTPHILRLISTPEDIMKESIAYFRIYSAGIFFSVMYNILMGILNAVGDSRHPLYYLIFASVLNIVLDILFIGGFGMGVGSAAAATIISQAVSSLLCFLRLLRNPEPVGIRLRKLRMNRKELGNIVRFGFPAGVQNSVIGLANTVVQASINVFPAAVIAGAGVYYRIEGFVLLPITTLSLSLTTSVGQNLGAGRYDRALRVSKMGMAAASVIGEAVAVILFITAPLIMSLFSSDPDVIRAGTAQARTEALFYCLVGVSHSAAGMLRGAGKSAVPMAVILGSWCVFRVIFLRIALIFFPVPMTIYVTYPVTWLLSSLIFAVYLSRTDWLHAMDRSHM